MRTRNSNFPNNSNVTIPRLRNKGRAPNIVEPKLRTVVEVAPIAERTIEEILRAPMEGYGEAIVLPEINADHFEINFFASIGSSEPVLRNVTNDVIKLMMFPYSLEGAAKTWENVIKTDKRIDKPVDQLSTLVEIVFKKVVTPAPVKAVRETCVTCGGAHSFAPTIKSLLMKKKKLLELAKIPLNENCLAMLLKKLPEKLGDPGKFLIPCNFPGMDLSLPELTPTRMPLELEDRSITYPKGLTEDVYVKVGKFHFPTDFVVVDFEADPRVPLILGRSFLRTGRALIDVYGEEITLRVDNEAVTFNLDQTTRYSFTNDKLVNRIDIIDAVYEEYAPELLGFSSSGNPASTSEPFTSEFILEEIEAYLKDDSISPEIDYAD
ncbi:reverse transcriptase domain-containing protein [Tanacetum coccineum]|uniref:Reverse transcriptase domain-containing protein n=1 Tax=Tanacetum coccineum TaxID=301880 RepID=A0ABQ5AQA2_9ASTR